MDEGALIIMGFDHYTYTSANFLFVLGGGILRVLQHTSEMEAGMPGILPQTASTQQW